MAAFVTRNREYFRPWEPLRSEEYFTVQYWMAALEAGVDAALEEQSVRFVLVPKAGETSRIIGQCTFSGIMRGVFQAAYLGYGLCRDFVGRGLMTEALRAAIAFGFDSLNLHRIMANTIPANDRSAAVLQRLGFVREGYARDYLYLAGRWQDHILTALTNDRWEGE